ncbi:MAG TPA: PadR family transcriptional regulator [Kofleriaceae bacterium]|nr:PadR family transcriptional regulator [Kofleriaceae bacterium]
MSSTTRLLVLGVVKLFQPVHGYDVRRELLSWRAQEWASVQPGSIYNALKTLTRDGLLEIASTDQVGGRPERTTYRLTQAGAEEFRTLLREEWWTVRPPIDPLMAAVSFLGETPRAEAIAALEHRAAQIHGMIRHLEFAIEGHDGAESPYHVREMMQLMTARVAAELAWSEQFIARLRNDEYITADDPPWQPPPPRPAPGPRRTTLGRRAPVPAAGNGRPPRREPPPRSAIEAAGRRIRRTGGRVADPRVLPAQPQPAPAQPGSPPRARAAPGRDHRRRTRRSRRHASR